MSRLRAGDAFLLQFGCAVAGFLGLLLLVHLLSS